MSMPPHQKPKFQLTKTLTKGGQVSLHNLRMVRQVLTVTLILSLCSGGFFWGTKTWFDYTPYQRYIIRSALWADIRLSLSGNKYFETQAFHHENGKIQMVQSLAIQNNKAIQFWMEHFKQQALWNFWLSLGFMGGMFIAICGFWVWRGTVKKAKEIVSGSQIVGPAVLQKLVANQGIASSFTLGGVSLRAHSETQHIMVCGTTGTGKSTCFYQLLPQIRAHNHPAVIVDTTGEFVARFYRPGKDILVNPFDERSVGWNPWVDCRSPYHYDELAAAFIPQTGYDSFWSASARTVFAESLAYLSRLDTECIDTLLNLLLETSLKDLHATLKHTPAASLVDPAGDRTAMSIRSHLSPYLKGLRSLPQDRAVFSIRDWIQKRPNPKTPGPQWVFIASTPDQRETLKPIMTGLMTSAINSLLGTTPDLKRRVWFLVDELASLNKQEALPKALAEIRKYGGCIAVGIQNIPQLQGIYGHAETKSLTSLFNTKVIFRNGDPETAKRLSQMLGEQEVKETVEGISYGANSIRDGVSLNEQQRLKPVVSPNDIMALNDLEAYLKLPGNLPITKINLGADQTPKISPAFLALSGEKPSAKRKSKKKDKTQGTKTKQPDYQ